MLALEPFIELLVSNSKELTSERSLSNFLRRTSLVSDKKDDDDDLFASQRSNRLYDLVLISLPGESSPAVVFEKLTSQFCRCFVQVVDALQKTNQSALAKKVIDSMNVELSFVFDWDFLYSLRSKQLFFVVLVKERAQP
jgi:hypothetical protein